MQGEKQQKEKSQNEKKGTEEKLMKEQMTKGRQEKKEPNFQKETRPPHPCPICGQMSQKSSYPFCSTRCRAIDLNRWLSGAYILPPPPQVSDEEE
ncbi:DNA gyrase inhibitor YacG [Bartonella sp. AU18XJBT]|uniref:DNA gyrase inhibitor YacG n=1 Tax=Bartonella sp. AU18XJBT TaxID=3019089 RepID=UPI00235E28C7|nr:DNA gyrase inhibitor YacG [Bartonella sp. AU18XJBT]